MKLSENVKGLIFLSGLGISLLIFLTFTLFETPPFWLKLCLGLCIGITCYFSPLARKSEARRKVKKK